MSKDRISDKSRLIGAWLMLGVLMIIVQIVLGGITRLTGSGLSITEWKPIMGVLPPLNDTQWKEAFRGYQQIAQFKRLNPRFLLSDFKFIFFWEWLHRLWGRLLGVVFLVPFLMFLLRGYIHRSLIRPLIILFLLGGLQGFIGWIMVISGLNDTNLYVNHIRLAVHFIAALILLVYTFWFSLSLLIQKQQDVSRSSLHNSVFMITALLFFQLIYGAFMAGLKAAVFAPTWPDINGSFLPVGVQQLNGEHLSFLATLIHQPLMVHFVHRSLAYLIVVLILIWTLRAEKKRNSSQFNRVKWLPLIFVFIQVSLGILATLNSYKAIPQGWGIFEWTAELHQLVAIFLLLSLVLVIYILRPRQVARRETV